MENQHIKIKGYKELDQTQIDLMNDIKEMGAVVGVLVEDVTLNPQCDPRWAAIAATDLQKGFMSLTRAVARPDFF